MVKILILIVVLSLFAREIISVKKESRKNNNVIAYHMMLTSIPFIILGLLYLLNMLAEK